MRHVPSSTARRRPLGAAAILAGLLALQGCELIGNPIAAMSSKKPSPDEFQVLARGELRLPPGLGTSTLPEPAPGTRSPLEPDPQAEAVAALTGRREAPGAPARSAIGRGEAALLAAADAQDASPDVREQIRLDAERIPENEPYKPPTIFELFGMGNEIDPEDLVDPASESRRLQTAGVAAPVDRDSLEEEAARTAEETAEAEAEAARAPEFGQRAPRASRTDQQQEGGILFFERSVF